MPLIQSAIKKMRKDKIRSTRNKIRENKLKTLIKKARKDNNPKNLAAAFSALDKAAKVNLIHPNKASRLKSRLSKRSSNTPSTKKEAKKKVAKKKMTTIR